MSACGVDGVGVVRHIIGEQPRDELYAAFGGNFIPFGQLGKFRFTLYFPAVGVFFIYFAVQFYERLYIVRFKTKPRLNFVIYNGFGDDRLGVV
jgi:hypothetical protein